MEGSKTRKQEVTHKEHKNETKHTKRYAENCGRDEENIS
jgi:hypothetical protein